MENAKLKPRADYLRKLISFQDTEPVKIVTGICRYGMPGTLETGIRVQKITDFLLNPA